MDENERRAWMLLQLDRLADVTDQAHDRGLISSGEAAATHARVDYQRRRLHGLPSRWVQVRVESR
jgi:hypothetical protein